MLVGLDNAGKTTLLNQMCLMDKRSLSTDSPAKRAEKKKDGINRKGSQSNSTPSSPSSTVPTLDFEIRKIHYKRYKISFTVSSVLSRRVKIVSTMLFRM